MAAHRAHALVLGATTSAALELDRRSDLARWAAGLTEEGVRPGALSHEAVARAGGVTRRRVEKDAAARAGRQSVEAESPEPEDE